MKTFLTLVLSLVAPVLGFGAACCTNDAASGASALTASLRTDSLYQVQSRWKNDAGNEVRLVDGRGRIRVVGMFYSACPNACPLLIEKLQKLDTALSPELRARVDFVLVSFDPETDTPTVLHAFRQNRGLNDSRWQFLSGAPANVRELAALLDIKFKKEANGTIAHSNIITVLDTDGAIAYQEPGLSWTDSKLNEHIASLDRPVSKVQ